MSEHKHTPGPWKEDRLIIKGKDQSVVCMVFPWDSVCPREEDQANARLIAAAPALLEALEAVEWGCYRVNFLGDRMVHTCPGCGCVDEYGHSEDCKLGNALKLVRGE